MKTATSVFTFVFGFLTGVVLVTALNSPAQPQATTIVERLDADGTVLESKIVVGPLSIRGDRVEFSTTSGEYFVFPPPWRVKTTKKAGGRTETIIKSNVGTVPQR